MIPLATARGSVPEPSLAVGLLILTSEHSILVRRLLRRLNADVPEFGDPTSLKAKEMNDSDLRCVGRVPDFGMNRNQIVFLQDVLDLECGVGKLFMSFRHAGFERLSIAGEGRVVMAKVRADVIAVRFV